MVNFRKSNRGSGSDSYGRGERPENGGSSHRREVPSSSSRAPMDYGRDSGYSRYSRTYRSPEAARQGDGSARRTHRAEQSGDARAAARRQPAYDERPAGNGRRATSAEAGMPQHSSDAYSAGAARAQYAERGKKKRRRKHIVVGLLALLLVVVLGGVAFGANFLSSINNALHKGLDDQLSGVLVDADIAHEPFYMLLLGTDASEDRNEDEEFGGVFRTDSIILARIDPVQKTAALVSIPRDTRVNIPGQGQQKINAAYAFGGASGAVTAVENLTGVSIAHYAEVNFDGFSGIVDSIGGVEVNVPITIDDDDAGGYIPAGEQTLNGEQALILCRARHAWDEYGDGDGYRAASQRLVISAIASKVLDSDIVTITNSVNAMAEYVTTDLQLNEIIALAQTFKDIDTETSLWTCAYPTVSTYENDIWWEVAQTNEWKSMLNRMQKGESPLETDEIDPETGAVLGHAGESASSSSSSSSTSSVTHTGEVDVRNGTETAGLAASAAEKIAAMGFTTTTGNADSDGYLTTTVVYDSTADAAEAQQIADALGVGSTELNQNTYIFNGKFLVVVGSDYTA